MYSGTQQPAETGSGLLSNSSDGPVIAEYRDINLNLDMDNDRSEYDEIPRQTTERQFSEEPMGSENSEDATRQLIETERRSSKPQKLHQNSQHSVEYEDTSDGVVSKGKRDNRKINSQDLDEPGKGVGLLKSNNSTELIKKQRKIKINVTTSNQAMQAYNGAAGN
jgi:hypothetical protein